jgi:hypothetical protein
MIELPTEKKWSGDGWGQEPRLLFQVKRSPKHAIYRVTNFKTGTTTGYEVFKIHITPKGTQIFDQVTEDNEEKYPTAERFGKTAWFTATIEQAEIIFDRLEKGLAVHDEKDVKNDSVKPKGKKPSFLFPVGDFSTQQLAEANHVTYPAAYMGLKFYLLDGEVKRSKTERIGNGKRATQFYIKTT